MLAFFLAKTALFFFIFGDFRYDFASFAGLVALGVALNGGICKRLRQTAPAEVPAEEMLDLPVKAAGPA